MEFKTLKKLSVENVISIFTLKKGYGVVIKISLTKDHGVW